ncbi:SSRP1 [Acrasis kona]|uniref:FACT complex subunit SSRP1 n=1 Tax=Acrasis kona TaxID=1008807 RepID=A0AAW2ZNQ7_9EUKA
MSTTATPAAPDRFKGIFLGGRNATAIAGELVVSGEDEKSFYWKANGSTNNVIVNKGTIDHFEWLLTGRGYALRIWKNGSEQITEFLNFKEADFSKLKELLDRFFPDLQVNKTELCSRGVNWGEPKFHGNVLSFENDNKEEFLINLSDVKTCTKSAKNELIVEFHNDDTVQKTDDMLVEMRFVIPKEIKPEGEEEEGEDAPPSINPFDQIYNKIISRAEISTDTGDAIASFEGLPFITPRGKYNVDMHKKYIRLHGKTYAFKVLYKSISTLFLLPKPGETHMFFVVSLDTPIRQGQKAYPYLVFQFDKSVMISKEKPLQIKMDKEGLDKLQDKTLKETMHGKQFEVVAKVFRALAERRLIGPGKFKSFTGDNGIKCSMKANEGFLFFLEKSLFFLHKPAIYMRHEEIKSFKFARTDNRAGGSRYFDLVVLLKNGKTFIFSNINRSEYENLIEFISGKNLHIENLKEMKEAEAAAHTYAENTVGGAAGGAADDDDEEDDEDFQADEHNSDEDDREFEEIVDNVAEKIDHGEAAENDDEASGSSAKKRKRDDEDAGDEEKSDKPKKKKKKASKEEAAGEEEEKPKKKKKKAAAAEGEEEKPKKKKKKAATAEGEEEKPKKKKKKATEEVVSVEE